MSVDCGSCLAKYFLCLFNFAFFILGSIVLGVGIWVAADKSSFIALLKLVENEHVDKFTQPIVIEQMAYVLIGCGILMFLLSFLGYVGAIRESSCLLKTYATFMILIVIVQLTLGGLAAIYKNDAKIETGNFLRSTISKYYNDAGTVKPDAVNLVWNQLMTDMRCCGVDSYKDFAAAEKWQATKGASDIVMPRECCQRLPASANGTVALVDEECPIRPTSENSYHTTGCYDKLLSWMLHNRNMVIYVSVGIGVTQLVLIFLSCCLSSSISKYRVMRL